LDNVKKQLLTRVGCKNGPSANHTGPARVHFRTWEKLTKLRGLTFYGIPTRNWHVRWGTQESWYGCPQVNPSPLFWMNLLSLHGTQKHKSKFSQSRSLPTTIEFASASILSKFFLFYHFYDFSLFSLATQLLQFHSDWVLGFSFFRILKRPRCQYSIEALQLFFLVINYFFFSNGNEPSSWLSEFRLNCSV